MSNTADIEFQTRTDIFDVRFVVECRKKIVKDFLKI